MSTDQYTPTDNEVREDFAYPWEGFEQNRPARIAAYDRWLVAHDARVKAEALREAAGPEWGNNNTLWSGPRIRQKIMRRADLIEQETPDEQ